MMSLARATDRTAVEHAIREARAGKSVAVAVSGEPGIGKSSALRGIGKLAAARGLVPLGATSTRRSHTVPFGVVVDALDPEVAPAVLEPLGEEQRAEVLSLWPSLGGPAAGAATDGAAQRRRCHAIHTLLQGMARERAILLALDDVHWADGATRELIDLLLRRPVPHLLLSKS